METLSLIGYASGIAANNSGCGDSPRYLQRSTLPQSYFQWHEMLQPSRNTASKLETVAALCQALAMTTKQLTEARKQFAVIGGDHSSAIGTWSGVQTAIAHKPLGLIWIDAHLDSHTPETTPSGNIHGMPLACLLGYGDNKLTQMLSSTPKILPENLCIIGARSYEQEEFELLQKLKVKIFFMDDIKAIGLQTVITQALKIVTANTAGYGLSIDLDAVDPSDAPGVGCPEADGLNGKDLCDTLQIIHGFTKPLGTEIVEFNPHRDQNRLTEQLITKLLAILTV